MNAAVSSVYSNFYIQKSLDLINAMLKLFKKHFNSTTVRGRANTAKLTYATFALIYLYHRYGKKKPPPSKAEIDALNKERGACATFGGNNMDHGGEGDTSKEERGSCGTSGGNGGCDTSKGDGESCATFKLKDNGVQEEKGSEKKAEPEAGVDKSRSCRASVRTNADTAKRVLYGSDRNAAVADSGPTKIVTSFGAAGKSAIAVEEIVKVGTPKASDSELSTRATKSKAEIDTAKETSKPATSSDENVAANVKSSLTLDTIEQGTLQNASLSAEVDNNTPKGTMKKIGEAVLQNF